MLSPVSSRSTTGVGSAVAGARGSIREREGPRAKKAAPGRSVSFARGRRTPPWSSTATPRWRGVNTALRRSFNQAASQFADAYITSVGTTADAGTVVVGAKLVKDAITRGKNEPPKKD
jgi:hypothetical protein